MHHFAAKWPKVSVNQVTAGDGQRSNVDDCNIEMIGTITGTI